MSVFILIGVQVIIVGVVLSLATPAIHRRWPAADGAVALGRIAALVGGIVLVAIDVTGGATPLSKTLNPVADTVTSVDAGRAVYEANCAACHGADAHGGGPLSGTTQIEPPSLVAHLTAHSDGDLFYWISNGLPGGMPAWDSTLSETDRWNVINYLRYVNGTQPTADVEPAAFEPLALPIGLAFGSVAWLGVGWRRRRVVRRG